MLISSTESSFPPVDIPCAELRQLSKCRQLKYSLTRFIFSKIQLDTGLLLLDTSVIHWRREALRLN
jgi:hypothetical protein